MRIEIAKHKIDPSMCELWSSDSKSGRKFLLAVIEGGMLKEDVNPRFFGTTRIVLEMIDVDTLAALRHDAAEKGE